MQSAQTSSHRHININATKQQSLTLPLDSDSCTWHTSCSDVKKNRAWSTASGASSCFSGHKDHRRFYDCKPTNPPPRPDRPPRLLPVRLWVNNCKVRAKMLCRNCQVWWVSMLSVSVRGCVWNWCSTQFTISSCHLFAIERVVEWGQCAPWNVHLHRVGRKWQKHSSLTFVG